jgi:uroporphyrinogen-III synthase
MNGQTVAILESRLGEQLAELIAKRGGKPVRAPALAEIPDVDPRFIAELIRDWQATPAKAAIFQTGVGTHALFKTTDGLGLTETLLALLAATTVVVRGPKPTGALRSRGVRIDLSAKDPFTTAEVLAELDALPLEGERVVVQRYGAPNPDLEHGLQAKGASVIEIPTYRWALPEDTRPMAELIAALQRHEIASVVFTSASQVHNLFGFAQARDEAGSLAANLNATLVASIGPVSTAALSHFGVKAALEASPPKLGPLVTALDAALSGP